MPWGILKENEFILGNLSIWVKAKNGTEAKKKLKKIISNLKKKGIKIDTSEAETIIGKNRDYIWK